MFFEFILLLFETLSIINNQIGHHNIKYLRILI